MKYHKTNLDTLRKEHDQLKTGGGRFLSPKVGENRWRILPPWSDAGIPRLVITRHRRVGIPPKTVLCLRMWGKPCPLCRLAYALRNSGDEDDGKLGEALSSNQRVFVNAVDRQNEDAGVQIGSLPVSVYQQIESMVLDPEWEDPLDPANGNDVVIVRPKEFKGGEKYQVHLSPKKTPLSKNGEVLRDWLNNLNDLEAELMQPVAHDAMLDLLAESYSDEYAAHGMEKYRGESTTEVAETKKKKKKKTKPAAAAPAAPSSVATPQVTSYDKEEGGEEGATPPTPAAPEKDDDIDYPDGLPDTHVACYGKSYDMSSACCALCTFEPQCSGLCGGAE